jgi:hypothetical protein
MTLEDFLAQKGILAYFADTNTPYKVLKNDFTYQEVRDLLSDYGLLEFKKIKRPYVENNEFVNIDKISDYEKEYVFRKLSNELKLSSDCIARNTVHGLVPSYTQRLSDNGLSTREFLRRFLSDEIINDMMMVEMVFNHIMNHANRTFNNIVREDEELKNELKNINIPTNKPQ